jgi:hypothetical protein
VRRSLTYLKRNKEFKTQQKSAFHRRIFTFFRVIQGYLIAFSVVYCSLSLLSDNNQSETAATTAKPPKIMIGIAL